MKEKRFGRENIYIVMTIFALLSFVGLSNEACAHGLGYAEVNEAPKAMRFYYSDDTPARFAEVIVLDPEGSDFLIGRTDARGYFAFIPEKAGTWTVEINDGMGHKAVASFSVADGKSISTAEQGIALTTQHDESVYHSQHAHHGSTYSHSKLFMAIFGVSILANLGLGISWYRHKKSA
ncbi:MAG: hypothetical protein R3Y11_05410 [Pseudomonadota bacterium]